MKKYIFTFLLILITLIIFNSDKIIENIYSQKKLISFYKKHLPHKYQLVIRKTLTFYNHKIRKKLIFKKVLSERETVSINKNKYLINSYKNNMLSKKSAMDCVHIFNLNSTVEAVKSNDD